MELFFVTLRTKAKKEKERIEKEESEKERLESPLRKKRKGMIEGMVDSLKRLKRRETTPECFNLHRWITHSCQSHEHLPFSRLGILLLVVWIIFLPIIPFDLMAVEKQASVL